MANLKEIRGRIKSVKNTQQITKAMNLVSASKLKKAQDNILGSRPYAFHLKQMIQDIALSQKVTHDLLELEGIPKEEDDDRRLLFVVLTSDRGLCGGFNNNVARWAERKAKEIEQDWDTIDFFFIGKKGREYFQARGQKGGEVLLNLAKEIGYGLAQEVSQKLLKEYTSGQYDEIVIVYNEFKSAIQQDVVSERLLPLEIGTEMSGDNYTNKDLIFEPDPSEIIEELLIKHFAVQIYRVMSESIASEHAARMTAMENATNNAKDVINKLTLTYNKMRQAAITTELIEITSGAEALKG